MPRRQASHPVPSSHNSASAHTHTSNALVLPDPNSIPERTESRSAPSSPTEKLHASHAAADDRGDALHTKQRSPRTADHTQGRPKSVLIDTSALGKYAEISFIPEQSARPAPPRRRGTKYSEIVHPEPAVGSGEREGAGQEGRGTPEVIDSSIYDTPNSAAPPVPQRPGPSFGEPEDPFSSEFFPTASAPATVAAAAAGGNHQKNDAGAGPTADVDPFVGFTGDVFDTNVDDPSQFYDHPPTHHPRTEPPSATTQPPASDGPSNGYAVPPSNSDTQQKATPPDEDDSSDFTGASTYEDASMFVRDLQRDRELRGEIFAPAADVFLSRPDNREGKEDSPQYDLPPSSFPECDQQREEDDAAAAATAYDFPAALSKHPYKRPDEPPTYSNVPQHEPHLHVVKYPAGTGKAASSSPQQTSRQRLDMPLPPIPPDPAPGQTQVWPPPSKAYPAAAPKAQAPPPLPARPKQPSSSAADLPPPLPPMSFPRKDDFPPLPPRKKTNGGPSGSPPSSVQEAPLPLLPGRGSDREVAIMRLVELGYSRSDIVRALAVAKNDPQLAELILKEFGHHR